MPKLSVVIITFNEERNIERCLNSVVGLADEILVVDSFSTDKTEEICNNFNARFLKHRFEGYIEQKNWAASQASYDHILSLDADEEISEKLKQSILKVKETWKYDGYYFNRLTFYCGKWIKHTSWYPARKLRLWDRRRGNWDGINPHDVFILQKGATQKHIKGDLLHYSYYALEEHIAQINSFTSILAKSFHRQGIVANYWTLLFHPFWRFFRDFFLKTGFLDGFYGLVISLNSAHETFLKYAKLKKITEDEKDLEPFRICFFNSTVSWGGGEKWHYDTATRIAAKGYDTIVITNQKSELLQQIKKTKLRYFRIFVGNLSFLNIFKIIQLVKYFRRQRVKTIIINLSADLKLAGISAKIAGVKKIIYSRGIAVAIKDSLLNRFLLRYVATNIIANSIETKHTILKKNTQLVDENKIKIIYNGIDFNEYFNHRYKEIYARKNDEVIIGNAGRFSEEKGHEHLIELARQLNEQNINFKLLLAGKGKLENKYKKSVEMLGLSNKVIFLGFVTDMISFHGNIDIFVLSSHYEGFGYVLIEAMAKEKPVIAFSIGSSAEIIDDGVNGFIIDKFNIPQLTEKVKLLIYNSELRKQFGQNGFKKVKELFSVERTVEEVESLIN
jgi:glycosyltransferase involved in cell wall biosynthesis